MKICIYAARISSLHMPPTQQTQAEAPRRSTRLQTQPRESDTQGANGKYYQGRKKCARFTLSPEQQPQRSHEPSSNPEGPPRPENHPEIETIGTISHSEALMLGKLVLRDM